MKAMNDPPRSGAGRRRPLGLGTATQGGLSETVSDESAEAVFQAAWDCGLRAFDTAPWYGRGRVEQRIGRFLQGKSGYSLSTKVGRLLRADAPPHPHQIGAFTTDSQLNVVYDYTYDGTMRSFEESLQRLGLEHIDTLYIHDPDDGGLTVADVLSGAGRALAELRAQGVVVHVGIGMNHWEMMLELVRAGMFTQCLLAGRYTLLEQGALPFLDACADLGVGVVIGGVFNSGVLADPLPGAWYDYAPAPPAVLERARALARVCSDHGVRLAAAALQFPLGHPAVVGVLTAAQRPDQLAQNVSFFETPIPPAVWEDLRAHRLLPEGVPTPTGQVTP